MYSYFKSVWRGFRQNKLFSVLNLLGLSVGLASMLMIWLWVNDELSVDNIYAKNSQLFQVMKTSPGSDGIISTYPSTPGLLAQEMKKELPELAYVTAMRPGYEAGILQVDGKRSKASSQFVDKQYFDVFSFRFLEGSRSNFESKKYSALVSDKLAAKLFGNTRNIVGRQFEWSKGQFKGVYEIAGVFASPPSNATDQVDLMFNYAVYADKEAEDIAFWQSNGHLTYLLVQPGTDIEAFNNKIKDFTKRKISQYYPGNQDMLKWEGNIFLQQYSARYLHGNYVNGAVAGGRIEYVKLFTTIAIFILIIACINFMNLSTARASKRMKEVGIKKVVGASRGLLILQFIGESMLMAFAALFIAFFLVQLLLPTFREITGKELSLELNTRMLITVIGITGLTGLIAGSYPALYLSRFKPVSILKGSRVSSAREGFIRKGLVVFQFSISIVLIVAVLVVYQQMNLIQSTNLGYNKDSVLSFSNDGDLQKNLAPFLAEVKNLPGVLYASSSTGNFFGIPNHGGGGISWEGKAPGIGLEYYGSLVGDGFFETMDVQLAEGRALSGNYADSNSVVFNQTAIAQMGIKNPIGKMVSLWGHPKQIVGVVKDYHFQSLYTKIGPAFIEYAPDNESSLVKIKAGAEKETIAGIQALFSKFNKGIEFSYSFLDDDYNRLYAAEQRVSVLSRYFAMVAILISCLGLFGLAAFTAQRRQKEIGIRKVIGASVFNVVGMLSKDFVALVFFAFCIAFPLSWWASNAWLNNFAYRISLSPLVFVITGVSVFTITLVTISFQSIRAAVESPVKSLRTE